MEQTEIQTYRDMWTRRKWWIIVPFLVTLLAGLTYLMFSPRLYEAKAVIFVQEQTIAQDVVDPMVSGVNDRFTMITQQVTSRTNLENIILKYGLYGSSESEMPLEEKVELFKQAIKIEPIYQTYQSTTNRNLTFEQIFSFTIFFRYIDAITATDVTNTLASNFISENLKIRENLVLGTSKFLLDELESVRNKLTIKEEEIKQYRENFMGGLPEQLQANLGVLERLEQQLDKLKSDLREKQNKKSLIKEQIALSTIILSSGEPTSTDIGSLRRELASLELRYSDNHPDIIRLRKMIAKVDEEISKLGTDLEKGELLPGVDDNLRFQFQDTTLEIKKIQTEMMEVQSQIKQIEMKVEESPAREQELLILDRDYNSMKEQYNKILDKRLEVETTVSMEKKQKGEQFRIVETAEVPTRPVSPQFKIVMVLALALGLGLGSGAAVLKEYTDTSYRTPEELKKDLQLPILTELPIHYTEKELRDIKRKNAFTYAAVGLGFVLSATAIVIAAEGMEKTLEFVLNIIGIV